MTHIEAIGDDEGLIHTMFCGEQCVILHDGTTIPEGFDFYLREHGSKADCPGCKGALKSIEPQQTVTSGLG